MMSNEHALGSSVPANVVSHHDVSCGDDGRKRRHESLSDTDDESGGNSSARVPVIETLQPPSPNNTANGPPAQRKRRVSTDSEVVNIPQANPIVKCISKPGKHSKKPQMKYDPDVPMTKEEATIWRREQRRKRNRESAAASRQRQRDRISELEVEVEQWKVKYDRIMRQVRELEQYAGIRPPSPALTSRDIFRRRAPHPSMRMVPRHPQSEHMMGRGSTSTPPCHPSTSAAIISPRAVHHPSITSPHPEADMYHGSRYVSPYSSPPPQDDSSSDEHEDHMVEYHEAGQRPDHDHSSKIPSRPGVSRNMPPGLNSNDSLLPPDLCMSETSKLEPMEQALLEEAADAVLCATTRGETVEHEQFDRFMFDAPEW